MRPKTLWSTHLPGTSRLWSPIVDETKAYVTDFNGPTEEASIHAVALSDGKLLWTARPDAAGVVKLVAVVTVGPLWWSA